MSHYTTESFLSDDTLRVSCRLRRGRRASVARPRTRSACGARASWRRTCCFASPAPPRRYAHAYVTNTLLTEMYVNDSTLCNWRRLRWGRRASAARPRARSAAGARASWRRTCCSASPAPTRRYAYACRTNTLLTAMCVFDFTTCTYNAGSGGHEVRGVQVRRPAQRVVQEQAQGGQPAAVQQVQRC